MAHSFDSTEQTRLQHAIDSLVKENATEIPFDAQVIEELARIAKSSGFESDGQFVEDAKLRPISTLLRFLQYVGV